MMFTLFLAVVGPPFDFDNTFGSGVALALGGVVIVLVSKSLRPLGYVAITLGAAFMIGAVAYQAILLNS